MSLPGCGAAIAAQHSDDGMRLRLAANEPGDHQVGDAATDQAAHQAQQSIAWLTRSAHPRTIGEALRKLIVEQRIIKVDKSTLATLLATVGLDSSMRTTE